MAKLRSYAGSFKKSENRPRAICILGMHRSGTSSVTRAINLLGAYLGENDQLMPAAPDNVEGFWEHLAANRLQVNLLKQLGRNWDTIEPLPKDWPQFQSVQPFKKDLAKLIEQDFSGRPLWAWKDPRTCLLLPLWRELLAEANTDLSCLFVIRNPLDVIGSMRQRDNMPFDQALGIWFNYNIAALEYAAGLPTAFLSYGRFLADWEAELRRCSAILNLAWPQDEAQVCVAINSAVKPGLRHNRNAPEKLQTLPQPAQELYQFLLEASSRTAVADDSFQVTAQRMVKNFRDYAAIFQSRFNSPPPNRLKRVWQRWQKSIRKRVKSK